MTGYFGPDSIAVRALRQRAVGLTYGQRALVVGATHPRLFVGTAQHTSHRATPWTRLALTARLFEAVFLGSKEQADRALAYTARRHASVAGSTGIDGGPAHRIGSPYSARDPELMWWTAAFTLDSVEVMFETLIRPLTADEREELLADFVRWAELFGMPRSAAPTDHAEFRRRLADHLGSESAYLTEEARLVGRAIAGEHGYPLPGPGRLGSPVLAAVVKGSLPEQVRTLFGLGWSAAESATYAAVTTASRLAHQRVPLLGGSPVLRGPSAEFYKAVGRTEQRLVRRGGISMPGVSDRPVTR